jgi:hypothetical protein
MGEDGLCYKLFVWKTKYTEVPTNLRSLYEVSCCAVNAILFPPSGLHIQLICYLFN